MYVYHSPIGDWFICCKENKYHLMFDSECYGVYDSPVGAADDVFCFATRCYEWDRLLESANPPADIYEWERC